jgi:hypothetical protein
MPEEKTPVDIVARCLGFLRSAHQEIAVAELLPNKAGRAIRIFAATIATIAAVVSIIVFEGSDDENEYISDTPGVIYGNIWFYSITLTVMYTWIYAAMYRYSLSNWPCHIMILAEIAAFCLNTNFTLCVMFAFDAIIGNVKSNMDILLLRFLAPYIASVLVFWTSESQDKYSWGVAIIFAIVHFMSTHSDFIIGSESLSATQIFVELAISAGYSIIFAAASKIHKYMTVPRDALFNLILFINNRCFCCLCCTYDTDYTHVIPPPNLSSIELM